MRVPASYFISAVLHTLVLALLASLGLSQAKLLDVTARPVRIELQATMPDRPSPRDPRSELAAIREWRLESRTESATLSGGAAERLQKSQDVLALSAIHAMAEDPLSTRERPRGSSRTAPANAEPTTAGATAPQRQPLLAEYRVVIELFEEGSEPAMAARPADGMDVEVMPKPLANNPVPPYPPEALAAKQQGRVVLAVFVGTNGAVINARLATSSGTPSLDTSALTTIYQWRFSPARRGGRKVAFEVLVPVRFELLAARQNVKIGG